MPRRTRITEKNEILVSVNFKEEDFIQSQKKKEKIKQKAMDLVQEYQDQLDPKVYDYSVEEIENYLHMLYPQQVIVRMLWVISI